MAGGRPSYPAPLPGPFHIQNNTKERITLDGWSKFDPNSMEAATPVNNGIGLGVTFSILGGVSTSNPGAGCLYVDPNPLKDCHGRVVTNTALICRPFTIQEISPPSLLTSDVLFVIGVLDRNPVDTGHLGVGFGLNYNSATGGRCGRRVLVSGIGGGSLIATGALNTNIRYAANMIWKSTMGVTGKLEIAISSAGNFLMLDSNKAALAQGFGVVASSTFGVGNFTNLYRFVAMMRTSITDVTTRSFTMEMYDYPDGGEILA